MCENQCQLESCSGCPYNRECVYEPEDVEYDPADQDLYDLYTFGNYKPE